MTRICLVDDHPLYRQGLKGLIATYPGYQVVGEASDRRSGLALVEAEAPYLVLLDLSLGEENGLELLKDIKARASRTKVLVVSMHDERVYAERALAAGASGYVQKQEASGKIMEAIQAVVSGRTWFSPSVRERLLDTLAGGPAKTAPDTVSSLSDRELEVFTWVGRGLGNSRIAEILGVSVSTVETHKKHLKEKLHCRDSEELKVNAVQWILSGRTAGRATT